MPNLRHSFVDMATDLPVPVEVEAYAEAQDRFCREAQELVPGLAVLALGGFSCPGISDIDLMCVVPPEADRTALVALCDLTRKDPLFVHGPFVVPSRMSADIKWMMPNVSYSPLAGRIEAHEDTLGPTELFAAAATHLVDALIEQAIWFRRMRLGTAFPVRKLILRLSGLKYQLSLAVELGVQTGDSIPRFANDVAQLRDKWANDNDLDLEEIWRLYLTAETLALDACQKVASTIMRRFQLTEIDSDNEIFLGRTILQRSDQVSLSVKQVHLLSRTRRYNVVSVTPDIFSIYLIAIGHRSVGHREEELIARRFLVVRRWRDQLQHLGLHGACLPPSLFGLRSPHKLGRLVDFMVRRNYLGLDSVPGPGPV